MLGLWLYSGLVIGSLAKKVLGCKELEKDKEAVEGVENRSRWGGDKKQ